MVLFLLLFNPLATCLLGRMELGHLCILCFSPHGVGTGLHTVPLPHKADHITPIPRCASRGSKKAKLPVEFVGKWMHFETLMLNETDQTQILKYYVVSLI